MSRYSGLRHKLRELGAPERGATLCHVSILSGKDPKSSDLAGGVPGGKPLSQQEDPSSTEPATPWPRVAAHSPSNPSIRQGLGPAPRVGGRAFLAQGRGDEGGSTKNHRLIQQTSRKRHSL